MTAFDREVEVVGEEIKNAVGETIDSGWFVLGEEVEQFESRFAELVGCRHGIGVNSGTDALALGLRALGVGHGDEVVTVAHTATATAAAIIQTGAEPVYVDVDPDTMVMDPTAIEDAITNRTAAVIPVHLYGQPVDMYDLLEVADANDVPILEDCSQAHGATFHGEPVGSFGDLAAFSFYPTKNLGAYGDAGLVATDVDALADAVRRRRQYGWIERNVPAGPGQNSRLDELQAAVLNEKLDHLVDWNTKRQANADRYEEKLMDTPVRTPARPASVRHVFHQYVIRTDDRDGLKAHLDDNGIQTQVHYPTPVHRQTGYGSGGSLPVTEELVNRILSLPVHPFLDEAEVNYVGNAIVDFFE